ARPPRSPATRRRGTRRRTTSRRVGTARATTHGSTARTRRRPLDDRRCPRARPLVLVGRTGRDGRTRAPARERPVGPGLDGVRRGLRGALTVGAAHLPYTTIAAVHGSINALGFTVAGLLGRLAHARPSHRPLSDPLRVHGRPTHAPVGRSDVEAGEVGE